MWWLNCFHQYFSDTDLAGQSMWAGSATALAEARAVPDLIMGLGRWNSLAWMNYVQKNPVLLHVLILIWTNHFQPPPIFA